METAVLLKIQANLKIYLSLKEPEAVFECKIVCISRGVIFVNDSLVTGPLGRGGSSFESYSSKANT